MNSRLCVAPRGSNWETYRFYEGLRAGCLVLTNPFPNEPFLLGAPVIVVDSWRQLPALLRRFARDTVTLERYRKAGLDWWDRHCSPGAVASSARRAVESRAGRSLATARRKRRKTSRDALPQQRARLIHAEEPVGEGKHRERGKRGQAKLYDTRNSSRWETGHAKASVPSASMPSSRYTGRRSIRFRILRRPLRKIAPIDLRHIAIQATLLITWYKLSPVDESGPGRGSMNRVVNSRIQSWFKGKLSSEVSR